MTPENFCYWLQGYFEIDDAGEKKDAYRLTHQQVDEIRKHLRTVFQKPEVTKPLYGLRPGSVTLTGGDSTIC